MRLKIILGLQALIFAQSQESDDGRARIRNSVAMNRGGSAVVVFDQPAEWAESSIRLGEHNFRTFPVPGVWPNTSVPIGWCKAHREYHGPPTVTMKSSSPGRRRFALIAYPWDAAQGLAPMLVAKGSSGNPPFEQRIPIRVDYFPGTVVGRRISLRYVSDVVERLDPDGIGNLLQRFVTINGKWRREDGESIAQLRNKGRPVFLWSGPFLRFSTAAISRRFGEVRRYRYAGRTIDEETHFGYDFFAGSRWLVPAANDGVVVYAAALRIYGNCVVIDHGYGLQSIYGHLSEVNVKAGTAVQKGQIIGRTGKTGLTEGDVLHFGLQIDGVPVDPREWWDEKWLADQFGVEGL